MAARSRKTAPPPATTSACPRRPAAWPTSTSAANLPEDARNLINNFQPPQDDARRKYEAAVREERETLLKELHRLHDLYAAQGQQAAASADRGSDPAVGRRRHLE